MYNERGCRLSSCIRAQAGKEEVWRNLFAKYREVILGLLILILLTVSWLLYASTLKHDFQNEIISSLEEVSTQGKSILEKR